MMLTANYFGKRTMPTRIKNYVKNKTTKKQRDLLRRLFYVRPSRFQKTLHRYNRHRQAEVCLLSYPKSGRTWLRVMLGHAIKQHFSLAYENIIELEQLSLFHPDIPRINVTHDDNPQEKTPDKVSANKSKYRHKSVVLLVRDPRDVIVSFYYQRTKRRMDYTGTLHQFLYNAPSLGSLIKFYKIWSENMDIPKKFHLVKYEDLHRQPHRQLADILAFIGIPNVSEETLHQSIEFAAFDNLRKLEESHYFESNILRPANQDDPDSFKVRRGKVGGYKDYLTQEEIAYVNSLMVALPKEFYGHQEE